MDADAAEKNFDKKFHFAKSDDWLLPAALPDQNELWQVDSLTSLKTNLNHTKSLLNDKGEDWHAHTASINKAANVINHIKQKIRPELLTQAWCKFYEILCSFDLLPCHATEIKSLHLCEAPGAFISALNYYLCLNYPTIHWEWTANTLNPYYEGHSIRNVVVDDRLLFHTLKNWNFGKDNTGDITNADYIDDLYVLAEKHGLYNLVTADGSFDCLSNPGEQERLVSKLQFAEVLTALKSLLPGGCLVIKKFTFFECGTIVQLYVLNCVFKQVHVFKPFTSRCSNSEVYVICQGLERSESLSKLLDHWLHIYRAQNVTAIYSKSQIPESFLTQIEACSEFFSNMQVEAILENISLYPLTDQSLILQFDDLKEACAEAFIQKYSIKRCPLYDACKLYSYKKKTADNFFGNGDKNQKSIYFMAVGDTFENIQKWSSYMWKDKILDVEKRILSLFPANKKRTQVEVEWAYPWKEVRKKMQSKNVTNWIVTGKKIDCIENSKFCFPIILYLWNQVSQNSQIDVLSHSSSLCYFPMDTVLNCLIDDTSLQRQILPLTPTENDAVFKCLKEKFPVEAVSLEDNRETKNDILEFASIVYINTTILIKSLQQECLIKKVITKHILKAIQIFKKGDDLILNVQSLLTRYSAGLIFMIMSMFEKFTTILPESAPASVGQIWIFKKFQETNQLKILNLLSQVELMQLSDAEEVLEIIPISSLCGGLFQAYLRDVNNKHLLQRIRNFISVEKSLF